MKKYVVLGIIFLFIINIAGLSSDSATSPVPSHFYKRYEGTINNKYKIILHITKHNDALSGYYYYTNQGIPLFLSGSSDTSDNFKLEESTRNGEATGQFSGKFVSANHIKGTWRTADKKKQFSFELKQSNSTDYVQCTTYELKESCLLFDDTDSPKIDISLFYVYPNKYKNLNTLKKLQKYILPEKHGSPQKALESMRDSYVTVFTEENRDIYDPDSEWMFMWQHSYKASPILNDKNLFACLFYFHDYMGGAHGLFGNGYITIDMTTGKKLKLDDIFIADYEQRLREIMDKKVREQAELL